MAGDNSTGQADLVLLGKVAEEVGKHRSAVWRHARKRGYTLHDVIGVRGQTTQALSVENATQIIRHYRSADAAERGLVEPLSNGESVTVDEGESREGVFYVVQVAPDLSPCRVKLGFTTNLPGRLMAYRTIAPTAHILHTVPCRPSWERAAIDSVTRTGCVQIGEEVFDVESLDGLLERLSAFFDLMPLLC